MWNQANPEFPVSIEIDPGRSGDQRRSMTKAADNGTADILNLDIVDIPEFAAANRISPISLDENLFVTGILKSAAVNGRDGLYWAAPFNTDIGVLFERIPAGGPAAEPLDLPSVLDELVHAGTFGFVGQVGPGSSASDEAFAVNILEHVLAGDPALLGNDTKLDERNSPFYEVARWQQALVPLRTAIADGRVLPKDNEPTSVDAFMNAKSGFMRNWPVAYRDLMERGDADAREGRIKVHSFPSAILGGQSLAVAANSSHKSQAIRLIEFLTSDVAQKVLAVYGLAPSRVAAYADPHLRNTIPYLETVRLAVEQAARNGRMRPIHRNYAAFTKAVATHIRPILATTSPVPSAFTDEIRAALSVPAI
jgi:multiple sugar transport system substrate-binding protein